MISSKLKQHAPYCHIYLEIIQAQWGRVVHIIFLFFGLAINIIVSTMLILGGSATVNNMTGIDIVTTCSPIPLDVSIYALTDSILTSDKVGAGLSAIKVASALMGKSGATIMLILLFLAVTSGISTEQITVSFILIYDVYDTYSRKIPTEKEILCVSRCYSWVLLLDTMWYPLLLVTLGKDAMGLK
ncbi:hypothetical protein L204_104872 [Cryptococcus depauperatus]